MNPAGRKPITRQRSEWIEDGGADRLPGAIRGARMFRRNVSDGHLFAIVADEPGIGWHLSISFRDHRGQLARYPGWDEIADARDRLLPSDVGFVMHLPPADRYVSAHDTTFHLHQFPEPEQ